MEASFNLVLNIKLTMLTVAQFKVTFFNTKEFQEAVMRTLIQSVGCFFLAPTFLAISGIPVEIFISIFTRGLLSTLTLRNIYESSISITYSFPVVSYCPIQGVSCAVYYVFGVIRKTDMLSSQSNTRTIEQHRQYPVQGILSV